MAAACEIQCWCLGFLCSKESFNHSHPLSQISCWSSIRSRTIYTWCFGWLCFSLTPLPQVSDHSTWLAGSSKSLEGLWWDFNVKRLGTPDSTQVKCHHLWQVVILRSLQDHLKVGIQSSIESKAWGSFCCVWDFSRGIQITFPSFPLHRLFG